MSESEQTRQANLVLPPRAGLIGAYAVTTSAANANLSLLDNQTKDPTNADGLETGVNGAYVTLYADGGPVYVLFGNTSASTSGGNAPVVATTGVNAAGVCWKIPADTPFPVRIQKNVDVWIGYIGTGTATLRVYRSSPYSQAC